MKKKGTRGRPRKQQQVAAAPVMSAEDDAEQAVAPVVEEENATEERIVTTTAQVRIFGFYLTFKFASKPHFPSKLLMLKHSNL